MRKKRESKIIAFNNGAGIDKTCNPNKEPLTLEKLRTFSGYENIADEEGEELVCSIITFTEILCDFLRDMEEQKALAQIKDSKSKPKLAA